MDFDEQEISVDHDSQLYEDAIELASLSGLGYSELDFDKLWPDMDIQDAYDLENIPTFTELEFQET